MFDYSSSRHARLDGFMLQESLLVVAIVAVMLSSGVPSFQAQVAERRARAGAHQLYAAVQFATVVLSGTRDPLAARPLCDGHFGGDVAAALSAPRKDGLLSVWVSVPGVSATNRTASAQVVGSLQWDA